MSRLNNYERGRRNEANLSYGEVAALLEYDGEKLIWRVSRGNVKVGSVAGSVNDVGYVQVQINGVLFKTHRVIWLLIHRHWPVDQLDHIDGNRQNNKLVNLREVTCQENLCNQNHEEIMSLVRLVFNGALRLGSGVHRYRSTRDEFISGISTLLRML